MIRFELWAHRVTTALYAVRIEAEQVTGVHGPLRWWWQAEDWNLGDLRYDSRPEAVAPLQEHPERFSIVEPQLLEQDRLARVTGRQPLLTQLVAWLRRRGQSGRTS